MPVSTASTSNLSLPPIYLDTPSAPPVELVEALAALSGRIGWTACAAAPASAMVSSEKPSPTRASFIMAGNKRGKWARFRVEDGRTFPCRRTQVVVERALQSLEGAALQTINNVAPNQILLEAGCTDFRDDRTHSAIAEAGS